MMREQKSNNIKRDNKEIKKNPEILTFVSTC